MWLSHFCDLWNAWFNCCEFRLPAHRIHLWGYLSGNIGLILCSFISISCWVLFLLCLVSCVLCHVLCCFSFFVGVFDSLVRLVLLVLFCSSAVHLVNFVYFIYVFFLLYCWLKSLLSCWCFVLSCSSLFLYLLSSTCFRLWLPPFLSFLLHLLVYLALTGLTCVPSCISSPCLPLSGVRLSP